MTRQLTISAALGFCVAFVSPAVSTAAIIFSNLGASPTTYNMAVGNFIGDDFVGDNLAEGDTFTPPAAAVFGSLKIALACNIASCPDNYSVSLDFDSGADMPGTAIESFVGIGATLGQLGANNPLIVFNSVLQPALAAGTQYWVSVTSDTNDSISWNLNVTSDPSDQAISADGGATYFSPSGLSPGAYEVDSAVSTSTPEPGSFLMLVGGIFGGLLVRSAIRRVA